MNSEIKRDENIRSKVSAAIEYFNKTTLSIVLCFNESIGSFTEALHSPQTEFQKLFHFGVVLLVKIIS